MLQSMIPKKPRIDPELQLVVNRSQSYDTIIASYRDSIFFIEFDSIWIGEFIVGIMNDAIYLATKGTQC